MTEFKDLGFFRDYITVSTTSWCAGVKLPAPVVPFPSVNASFNVTPVLTVRHS